MTAPVVDIIGAGLAGSEAACLLASNGVTVRLHEMRPGVQTPAHATDMPAELVCSNSFKSQELPSAHGLLKEELRLLASPLLAIAQEVRVPAGSALAVDRQRFSQCVLDKLRTYPNLTLVRHEVAQPPDDGDYCIIAAGPLASAAICAWMAERFSATALNFYDAIAPIVAADSIDYDNAFFASRWESETSDYLNCPFTEEEYRRFYDALIAADQVGVRAFENERFFEACLPVEVAAQRGFQALAFGTMRPIGLVDPRTGRRPFAVCQLRKETLAGEAYNMVGFQTRLTIGAQQSVFRTIPALRNAEFLRWGSIHRNTYLDSPRLLATDLSCKDQPNLFLAGQICGNEGYTESIATGHLAARFVLGRLSGRPLDPPPPTTACGALLRHVTASPYKPFSPSNINFGLMEPLPPGGKKRMPKDMKKTAVCERAVQDMRQWIGPIQPAAFADSHSLPRPTSSAD
jgi:methylenetetrahydrofolate--tRNA-(uracil-5-)-methyltransferase